MTYRCEDIFAGNPEHLAARVTDICAEGWTLVGTPREWTGASGRVYARCWFVKGRR